MKTREIGSLRATKANVASATSSTLLFTSSEDVISRKIWNDSSSVLYVSFGSSAASATSCTVKIAADGYYEFPFPSYRGDVYGIWVSANGAARTTEEK